MLNPIHLFGKDRGATPLCRRDKSDTYRNLISIFKSVEERQEKQKANFSPKQKNMAAADVRYLSTNF
jgi:hypothetical protein